MHILFASSEVDPYAKTGGLADVASALPKALAARGHTLSVVLPFYQIVRDGDFALRDTGWSFSVPMEGRSEVAHILSSTEEESGHTVYFVRNPRFFEQGDGIYGDEHGDYPNQCERFVFLCKATLELARKIGRPVDIIHANDWQTALLPIYREAWYADSDILGGAKSVFTVHNLAYQGGFPEDHFRLTGLPPEYYTAERGLEFFNYMSLLKGGLQFADAITTVSPRYAREIQIEAFGCGLDGVLRTRSERLVGILNGIDEDVWNPKKDPHIAAPFSAAKTAGKKKCKAELQEICGFEQDPKVPLIGLISRLVDQKGLDLVAGAVSRLAGGPFQFVLLGTGAPKYHHYFKQWEARAPKQFRTFLTFDNVLAHKIEAGADLFLMPSRYEPCGLNQMYSLRYGTLPIVRETGGLADTVVNYDPRNDEDKSANGFSFAPYTVDALTDAIQRAFAIYPDRRTWLKLMKRGMRQDWSWDRSAALYEELYQTVKTLA
ncbi:MAG: glycogen synthase GlgA [Gemmatimonadetes bacterium]|nr:glycogen synthase GlgA [Gemmatimonadota bacterium]